MSIDEHGFLSDDIVEYRGQIQQQYAQHFDFIYRVNAFCQQAKFSIEVDNQDGQKVIALCLLIKLPNDAKGAVLLIERGLGSQARTLVRAAHEALFILGKVCQDEEFHRSFIIAKEKSDRLKSLNVIKNDPARGFDEIIQRITPETRMKRLEDALAV